MKKLVCGVILMGCSFLMWRCNKDHYEIDTVDIIGKKFVYTNFPDFEESSEGHWVYNDTIFYDFISMDSVVAEQRWYIEQEDGSEKLTDAITIWRSMSVVKGNIMLFYPNEAKLHYIDKLMELEWHVKSITAKGIWIELFNHSGKKVMSDPVFLQQVGN